MDPLENSNCPLYMQLKKQIKYEICSGVLQPGDKIPTETELEKQYNVSRITVRKAIHELAIEGYVTKAQGIGTFINKPEEYYDSRIAISFTEMYEKLGMSVGTRIIFAGLVCATQKQAEFWQLPAGELVVKITRVRSLNNIPMVYETNYFSKAYSGLLDCDITGSIYRLLINNYHSIPGNKNGGELSIITPPEEVAQNLRVERTCSVMFQYRGVCDIFNQPLHIVEEYIRTDVPNVYRQYM